MRWTSRSGLWGLLTLLLFGLVLMHHTPGYGGHDLERAAVTTPVTDSGMAMIDNHAMAHDAPLSSDGGESGTGESGTTALLHLCLAVLAVLGGMLTAGLLPRGSLSHITIADSSGRRIGLEYLRPLVPVSHRLAALCVLRL
ncbi:MAG: hypothetical protein ACRDTG_00350 [Pseudonocardiaceae bacterium]